MLAQTPNWDSPLGLDPLMPIPSGSPSLVMEAIDGSDHHWVILAERRRVAWLSHLGHSENHCIQSNPTWVHFEEALDVAGGLSMLARVEGGQFHNGLQSQRALDARPIRADRRWRDMLTMF